MERIGQQHLGLLETKALQQESDQQYKRYIIPSYKIIRTILKKDRVGTQTNKPKNKKFDKGTKPDI